MRTVCLYTARIFFACRHDKIENLNISGLAEWALGAPRRFAGGWGGPLRFAYGGPRRFAGGGCDEAKIIAC